jgi:Fur family ferric uptake transcriptional regulator
VVVTEHAPGPAVDWTAQLRERGYRLTPQRQLVLEAVRELGHSTPDEIAAAVKAKAPAVNLSTVYRTLELLAELGLVTHTHLGHGPPTYHSADADDHVHLVCHRCGEVIPVDSAVVIPLAGTLRADHAFEMDMSHCVVHGVCAGCRED